jgi:hypothetical protein
MKISASSILTLVNNRIQMKLLASSILMLLDIKKMNGTVLLLGSCFLSSIS